MTRGPIHLDIAVGYATARKGVPAAASFRRWAAAALDVAECPLHLLNYGTLRSGVGPWGRWDAHALPEDRIACRRQTPADR